MVNDSYMWTRMVDTGVTTAGPLMKMPKDNRVPYVALAMGLERHAELGYGDRVWPREVIDYLRQHYACQEVFKRPFGLDPLVICTASPRKLQD